MADGVAVIIAAWNAAPWVGHAIASALAEPEAVEVWLVNDASTDDTEAVALGADDGSGRLRVITMPANAGPAAARNEALRHVTQPFVAILDADDFFLPGRLRVLLAEAADCDMVADDVLMVGDSAYVPSGSVVQPARFSGMLSAEAFILGNLAHKGQQRSELGFLKPLIRVDSLRRHGLGYDPNLWLGEDYDLYARMLLAGGRFKVVDSCGYVSLWRDDSMSGLHGLDALTAMLRVDRDLLELARTVAERSALHRHIRHTVSRAVHREVIDIRKARGTLASLRFLAAHGREAPAILAKAIAARLWRPSARTPMQGRSASRLIGSRMAAWPSAGRSVKTVAQRPSVSVLDLR